MKINENGASIMTATLLLAILALVSLVGWGVYDRQNKNDDRTNPTTKEISKAEDKDTVASSKQIIDNSQFSIALPIEWIASSKKLSDYEKSYEYKYENINEEKELIILVNPPGFGPNNDSLNYKIINNKIELELNSLVKCTESPPCSVIKNRIDATITEKDGNKINGNAYIFIYRDSKTDSGDSLELLKNILGSIIFK